MTGPALTLQPVAARDWPALADGFADLTFEQSLSYAEPAAARIGARAEFVAVMDEGRPVAAACLRIRTVPGLGRGIAWIAAGPLIRPLDAPLPDAARITAILATLRDHTARAGHILRLRFAAPGGDLDGADTAAAMAGFRPTDRAAGYSTVLIDLAADEDTLMKGLHGKWRNPLRNALKTGMELETLPFAEGFDRFMTLYREVQGAKGFAPDIPPEFFVGLSGPDFTHDLLIARQEGQDLGGMTIGRTGPNAVYLFGATTGPGRRLNAGHFLMWQSMLHCRAAGARVFDLGGIDADDNPDVTRFKLRTGGAEITALGPYEHRPATLAARLTLAAEALHARLKGRR